MPNNSDGNERWRLKGGGGAPGWCTDTGGIEAKGQQKAKPNGPLRSAFPSPPMDIPASQRSGPAPSAGQLGGPRGGRRPARPPQRADPRALRQPPHRLRRRPPPPRHILLPGRPTGGCSAVRCLWHFPQAGVSHTWARVECPVSPFNLSPNRMLIFRFQFRVLYFLFITPQKNTHQNFLHSFRFFFFQTRMLEGTSVRFIPRPSECLCPAFRRTRGLARGAACPQRRLLPSAGPPPPRAATTALQSAGQRWGKSRVSDRGGGETGTVAA